MAEVERLLELSDVGDDFLEPPASVTGVARSGRLDSCGDWAGRVVGSFRLTQILARGGMASVWLGERADGQYRQQVAVKLLTHAWLNEDCRRRFHRERQVLARLEHPGITRLIDGGTTEEGVPFLVMEYIDGRPIHRHADALRLSIADRLRLLLHVCDALQYAHQSLVIHRDLKPTNILVTPDGTPKLLDFGIAKLLEDAAETGADPTLTSVRALTPQYASPEQLHGEPAGIASDVYSLGVVCYELLTGRLPFPKAIDHRGEYEYSVRIADPVPPSRVVACPVRSASAETSSTGQTLSRIAEQRGETPRTLPRRLSGDLDSILLTALARDPAERYSSVQSFADDLRRCLCHQPVLARRRTVIYALRKFVRRNRAVSAALSALAAALLVSVGGIYVGLRRAEHERHVAQRVAYFLEDVFTSSNPYRLGHDANIFDLLQDAAKRADAKLGDEPAVQATVHFTIARAYALLWRWPEAERHARRAVDLARLAYQGDHPLVGDCLAMLGRAQTWSGDHAAVATQTQAFELRKRLFGDEHPIVAESKFLLAFALWDSKPGPPRWEEAERLFIESIAALRKAPEAEKGRLALALYAYTAMRQTRGDDDAEIDALIEESVRLYHSDPMRIDRYAVEALRRWSLALRRNGRFVEEAQVLGDYIAATPPFFQGESRVRGVLWRLVEVHQEIGDLPSARAWFRRVLALECRACAERTPERSTDWTKLAAALNETGTGADDVGDRAQQILALLANRLCSEFPFPFRGEGWGEGEMHGANPSPDLSLQEGRSLQTASGASSEDVALVVRLVSWAEQECVHEPHEAYRTFLEQSLALCAAMSPPDAVAVATSQGALGDCLMRLGRLEEAEPLLVSSMSRLARPDVLTNPQAERAIRRLVDFHEARGDAMKAESYRRLLPGRKGT